MSDLEKNYALLRAHFEELVHLTEEDWAFVRPFFRPRKLRKHQFLIQKGDEVPCEFWIVSGLIKAYIIDNQGKEHILQFAMEEYWTSDYQAFQNRTRAELHIDCVEDLVFFALRYEDRETICEKVPAMANFFRIKANYGYIALQQRILSLLTETAAERYTRVLQTLPQLMQRVPKRLLASFLGVSRETLSRLK